MTAPTHAGAGHWGTIQSTGKAAAALPARKEIATIDAPLSSLQHKRDFTWPKSDTKHRKSRNELSPLSWHARNMMSPSTTDSSQDTIFLQLALEQAQAAANLGEIPVGAVVVCPSAKVIGQGYNRTISNHDPSAHAEILALRAAAQTMNNHRLQGCTLYVTLEPCAMCSGAILHARVARVVYAVPDPKTGAAGSVLDLFANDTLNHQTLCEAFTPKNTAEHALRHICTEVLQEFFHTRRQSQQNLRQRPQYAPLREDALRPITQRFSNIAALRPLRSWSTFALLTDPRESGSTPWRMHAFDTAPQDNTRPVVLLLHGYASYSLLWSPLISILHNAGWRVLVPDLLGHGQSDIPKKTRSHSLTWHATLLQQWLQQADFFQHTHRAMILHDSAGQLLPDLIALNTKEPLFDYSLHLQPIEPMTWRLHCQQRTHFDLDTHWAINAEEIASGAWSAPWPAGHRSALQWAQWANTTQMESQRDTIRSAPNIEIVQTPSNGTALRRWIDQQAQHLLSILNRHITQT